MPSFPNGVWLIGPEGPHRVPNTASVIAYFEGRGYEVTDLPGELDADDPEFVELLEKRHVDDEPLELEEPTPEAKSAAPTKKEDK